MPGWYADPEDRSGLRYWDGDRWTARQPLPPAELAPAATQLGAGFHHLGWTVRTGVRLLVGVSAAQLAHYAWGYAIIEDAYLTGDVDRVELFDRLDIILGVAILVLLVPTAICWMIWQYRLARSARPGELRRAAGWHAWGYVVPIVSLWFPFQNMTDLVRRRFPDRSGTVVGWWWALLLVGGFCDRLYVSLSDTADSPEDIQGLLVFGMISAATFIAAGPLALKLNRDLSDAEKPSTKAP